jgi:hypothetical protein
MNKGGFSFVAMLVINPVVILFYQNCSMAPVSYAAKKTPPAVERQIASVEAAKPIQTSKVKSCESGKPECSKTIE